MGVIRKKLSFKIVNLVDDFGERESKGMVGVVLIFDRGGKWG